MWILLLQQQLLSSITNYVKYNYFGGDVIYAVRHCKFSDFSSRQNVGIIEGLLEFDQGYKTIDKQYHQTFIISRIVVGNKIVDHWDVINWSITCRRYSSFILILEWTPGLNGSGKGNCKTRWETVILGIWCGLHLSFDGIKTHQLCICKSNLKHSYTLLYHRLMPQNKTHILTATYILYDTTPVKPIL